MLLLSVDALEHGMIKQIAASTRKKQSSAIIAADVRRFAYLINTDEVFGTHRP
jgi:hypothetical protein